MDTLTRIETLLKANRLTQKELTDKLGLDKSAFSQWKRGKSKSYEKYLPQIAGFLSVSVEELTDSDPPDPDENLIILTRAIRRAAPENRKKLLEIAKIMFEEDFDDEK